MPLGLGTYLACMAAGGMAAFTSQVAPCSALLPLSPKLPTPGTPSPPLPHASLPPLPPPLHLQPGFGFITFEDERDADDAVAGLDGKNGWKVERARPSRREGGGGFGGRGGGGYGGGGVSWGCMLERGVCPCS